MSREVLKYKIIQAKSIWDLTEEVNKLMRRKPDYKPQGGVAIRCPDFFNVFYQAMVRPLDKGEKENHIQLQRSKTHLLRLNTRPNLVDLYKEVQQTIQAVYEDQRKPEDINVAVQINLGDGEALYSRDVSIKYDNDSCVSGCVILGE